MEKSKSVLYIFLGLPGTGKSTLAKNLARKLNAVYIRTDTVEQGIRDLCHMDVQGEGYRLAYRIAEDNLKIGNSVVRPV
jgi:predicted kinase